jgi:hypothetical protein
VLRRFIGCFSETRYNENCANCGNEMSLLHLGDFASQKYVRNRYAIGSHFVPGRRPLLRTWDPQSKFSGVHLDLKYGFNEPEGLDLRPARAEAIALQAKGRYWSGSTLGNRRIVCGFPYVRDLQTHSSGPKRKCRNHHWLRGSCTE